MAYDLLTKKVATPGEDRSAVVWKVINECIRAGMSDDDIFTLVQACAYNKYRGQDREERMLSREIEKARAEHEEERSGQSGSPGSQ